MKIVRSRLMRTVATTIVAAVAAAVGALAVAQPAAAATGWDRCPIRVMCVFEHANGLGHFAYFAEGSSNLTVPIGGFVFNDRITSIWNRHLYGFCVNRDINHNTPMFVAVGESGRYNLPTHFNDRISSLAWRTSRCTASTPRLP